MPKALLALLVLAIALAGCGGGDDGGGGNEEAVDAAKQVFAHAEESGADLSTGPCLAESLPGNEDWVADIAHDPRETVDDDPANQCDRYRAGIAHHFVELSPEGDVIRAE